MCCNVGPVCSSSAPSPGVPEIHFISHASCPATGGTDVVVIGRNFVKDDSKLFVVERNEGNQVRSNPTYFPTYSSYVHFFLQTAHSYQNNNVKSKGAHVCCLFGLCVDDCVIWEREVPLLQENFNQVHLVGSIPPYREPLSMSRALDVSLCVRNKGGKQSEPYKFSYVPGEYFSNFLVACKRFSLSFSLPFSCCFL